VPRSAGDTEGVEQREPSEVTPGPGPIAKKKAGSGPADEELRARLADEVSARDEADRKREVAEGERRGLAKRADEMEAALADARTESEALAAKVSERDQMLEDVQGEVQRTAADLKRALAQRDAAERAMEAAEKQQSAADEVAREARAQRRVLEQSVASLKEELDQARATHAEEQAAASEELERTRREAAQALSEAKAAGEERLAHAADQVSRARGETAGLQEELSQARRRFDLELAAQRDETARLAATLTGLRGAEPELRSSLEGERHGRAEDVERLEQAVAEAQAARDAAAAREADAGARLVRWQADAKGEVERQIAEEREARVEAERRAEETERRIATERSARAEVEALVAEHERARAEAERHATQAGREIGLLTARLEESLARRDRPGPETLPPDADAADVDQPTEALALDELDADLNGDDVTTEVRPATPAGSTGRVKDLEGRVAAAERRAEEAERRAEEADTRVREQGERLRLRVPPPGSRRPGAPAGRAAPADPARRGGASPELILGVVLLVLGLIVAIVLLTGAAGIL
jgi:predicted  nucleic acid-binding Zn-ribbon protein